MPSLIDLHNSGNLKYGDIIKSYSGTETLMYTFKGGFLEDKTPLYDIIEHYRKGDWDVPNYYTCYWCLMYTYEGWYKTDENIK